jgi:hypothetical protein
VCVDGCGAFIELAVVLPQRQSCCVMTSRLWWDSVGSLRALNELALAYVYSFGLSEEPFVSGCLMMRHFENAARWSTSYACGCNMGIGLILPGFDAR